MTTRIKKLIQQVPRSKPEMEAMVKETVAAQIEAEKLIAQRDAARAKADEPYAPRISEMTNVMARNLELLEAWAETNRPEFDGDKSLIVAGHRMGWKLGNWKTALKSKTKWADVVSDLKTMIEGGDKKIREIAKRWLRIKAEPDKESMIADREDVTQLEMLNNLGVEIVQDETFYLAPDRAGQDPALLTV